MGALSLITGDYKTRKKKNDQNKLTNLSSTFRIAATPGEKRPSSLREQPTLKVVKEKMIKRTR